LNPRKLTELFSEAEIALRVSAVARDIASLSERPQIAVSILVGGFVFAADLIRALAREGAHLEAEFLWLRSYGNMRAGGAVSLLAGPSENVRGKHILLIDGVLDVGRTILKAQQLLRAAGAASIVTAVAIDKSQPEALAAAEFACFSGVSGFIVGYGMDDAGQGRGLPHIARVE
jgi:hypoxanthine phosphoribosyltransferase